MSRVCPGFFVELSSVRHVACIEENEDGQHLFCLIKIISKVGLKMSLGYW